MNRRFFALGGLAAGLSLVSSRVALSETGKVVSERFLPRRVKIKDGFSDGDIHVDSEWHFIYLIEKGNTAIRYGCAVGEEGKAFKGEATIGRMEKWPKWTPTKRMIEEEPEKYKKWSNGMPGGPKNPLGARALYLYQNDQDTIYRIHGTPQLWTIGLSVSSGCIRMANEHVTDLYERVGIGTRVFVF